MEQEKRGFIKTILWLLKLVLYSILGLIAIMVLAALFAGDGGSTDKEITTACLEVPEALERRLNDGLNIQGGGSIRNLQAVKSDDYASVYFVSGDLQGAGLEGADDLATFATNKLNEPGLTFSVDSVAEEFSDWPRGDSTEYNISMFSHGVEESRDCVSS